MNTFFGVIGLNQQEVEKGFHDLKEKIFSMEYDHECIWIGEGVALGSICHTRNPEPISLPDGLNGEQLGLYIIGDSRIDYREKLREELNLSDKFPQGLTDNQLLLQAYKLWGGDCCNYLYGDFSFAIWDENRKELFCARDHFGLKPFYYVNIDGFLMFSNDIKGLVQAKAINHRIKDITIIDSLMGLSSNKSESGYENIKKLEPAHRLLYNRECELCNYQYWDLRDVSEINSINELEASAELRDRFIQAVDQRIRADNSVGFELSGGLDSSAVTTIGAKLIKDRKSTIHVFSQVLPENHESRNLPFGDESKFGNAIIDFCGIKNFWRITCERDGALEAIERQVQTYIATIGQTVPFMMDKLYNEARIHGVNVVLSGFGGDEGVTSRANGIFEELVTRRKWNYLKEQLRRKVNLQGGNYFRSLLKYFLFRVFPYSFAIFRHFGIFPDYRKGFYKNVLLDRKIRKVYSTKRRFMSLGVVPRDPIVRDRQYHTLMYNHIVDRIENTYHYAKIDGVEYRYPFLDVKLVEYYYSLPAILKNKDGYGRYIFRKAMEKELPTEICWRTDKSGASVPNSLNRFLLDIEKFKEIIEEGRRNNRFHYVDYVKTMSTIDDLVDLSKGINMRFGPRLFYSTIRVLILQKWQREGKIDIGIKC